MGKALLDVPGKRSTSTRDTAAYMHTYNYVRGHQSHEYVTPFEVYHNALTKVASSISKGGCLSKLFEFCVLTNMDIILPSAVFCMYKHIDQSQIFFVTQLLPLLLSARHLLSLRLKHMVTQLASSVHCKSAC